MRTRTPLQIIRSNPLWWLFTFPRIKRGVRADFERENATYTPAEIEFCVFPSTKTYSTVLRAGDKNPAHLQVKVRAMCYNM